MFAGRGVGLDGVVGQNGCRNDHQLADVGELWPP
jgi:hypothetical protein